GYVFISSSPRPHPNNSCAVNPQSVDGAHCIQINKSDAKLSKTLVFFQMVDHIAKLRSNLVESNREQSAEAVGPLAAGGADAFDGGPRPKRSQRDSACAIDLLVTIGAKTDDVQTHRVHVAPTASDRATLAMELHTKIPKNEDIQDQFCPGIDHATPDVQWLAKRSARVTHYYNDMKWVSRETKVAITPTDHGSMQEASNRVAESLQDFYNRNHRDPS
ncbi:unnamed protein product, partial [Prorocentrum cordatum]